MWLSKDLITPIHTQGRDKVALDQCARVLRNVETQNLKYLVIRKPLIRLSGIYVCQYPYDWLRSDSPQLDSLDPA